MFSLKSKNNSSAFTELLDEGLTVRKELERLRQPAKLSAGAFLKESLEIAGATEDDLDRIGNRLKGPGFEYSQVFIKKAGDYIISKDCSRPSSRLNRLSFLVSPQEFSLACSEAAAISASAFTLFAIAARRAAKEHPDCFGDVLDLDDHQRQLKEAEAKLQCLCQKISTSWTAEDINLEPAGGDLFRVRYKGTPVSVGGKHSGQALLDHLLGGRK